MMGTLSTLFAPWKKVRIGLCLFQKLKLNMVVHTCNTRIWEAEAEGPIWSTFQVPGHWGCVRKPIKRDSKSNALGCLPETEDKFLLLKIPNTCDLLLRGLSCN